MGVWYVLANTVLLPLVGRLSVEHGRDLVYIPDSATALKAVGPVFSVFILLLFYLVEKIYAQHVATKILQSSGAPKED